MANDARKVSELGITTSVSLTDRAVVLTNPTGSRAVQTITVGNLANNIGNIIVANVQSSIIPSVNTSLNLGSNLKVWNALHVKTVFANGSSGSANQVLYSNGSATYWSNPSYNFVANSSNWSGAAPTTIDQAIDRLAIVIKTLNGGTGA